MSRHEADRRRSPRHEGQAPADHAARDDARRSGSRREGRHRHRLDPARAARSTRATATSRPRLFSMPGENFFEIGTGDDFVRWAFKMLQGRRRRGLLQRAAYATIKRMADEAIPVIGHVGLIPSRRTWTGGWKAVGKTAETALEILEAVKQLEAAGAFGAEIEVVPVEVAEAISKRTSLLMLVDGRRHRLRRAVSVRRGHSRHQPRPHAAPFQGLPQLRRRI